MLCGRASWLNMKTRTINSWAILAFCIGATICFGADRTGQVAIEVGAKPKPLFLGQSFDIPVVLRNCSDKPIKTMRPFEATLGIGIVLMTNNVKSNAIPILQSSMNTFKEDVLALAVGESVTNTLALTDLTGAPKKEGNYLVALTYRSYVPEALQVECTAEVFTVEYRLPAGDEFAAWQLFKDHKEHVSGIPMKHVLQEIIKKYPETTYAAEAQKLMKRPYLKE